MRAFRAPCIPESPEDITDMIYRVPVSVVPVVSNVGHIKYRHGWTTEYCHRRNVFIFIVSGEFTFVFRERRTTVRAGCYQVIPAGTPYRVSAGDDCDYYYAHFSASVPLKSVSKEEAKSALESLKSGRELPELAENDESTCIFLPETGSFGENTESMKYRFSRVEMSMKQYGVSPDIRYSYNEIWR